MIKVYALHDRLRKYCYIFRNLKIIIPYYLKHNALNMKKLQSVPPTTNPNNITTDLINLRQVLECSHGR